MWNYSQKPITIRIILFRNFPAQPPILVVMDRVVHKDINPNDHVYVGELIKKWNFQSNLVLLL